MREGSAWLPFVIRLRLNLLAACGESARSALAESPECWVPTCLHLKVWSGYPCWKWLGIPSWDSSPRSPLPDLAHPASCISAARAAWLRLPEGREGGYGSQDLGPQVIASLSSPSALAKLCLWQRSLYPDPSNSRRQVEDCCVAGNF